MSNVELSFGLGQVEQLDRQELGGYLARLDTTWDESLEAKIGNRVSFHTRLIEKYGAGLDAMTMLHEYAWEAADWAARGVDRVMAGSKPNVRRAARLALAKPADLDPWFRPVRRRSQAVRG